MFCGCSKQKPQKGLSPGFVDESVYGLLEDIPEYTGVEVSDSWCPVLKCDHPAYPSMHHRGKCVTPSHNPAFDSGIDTGSSPDSRHSNSQQQQPIKVLDPYGSLPLLEVCEKGTSATDISSSAQSRMFQTYRGQLKLSGYLNSGLLTLHVRHAKHLHSRWSEVPSPYVKVSLIPDNLCKTRCKTRTVIDMERPTFDEKFSFEIGDSDFNRRLLISVWSKDPSRNHSELLGCMSFGIHNIVRGKTSIHGWYFLLSEQVGRRKHLQAHNKRHLVVDTDNRNHGNLPCMSGYNSVSEFSEGPREDIMPHSSVLHMRKGESGYGCTLSGGCPSLVFTIEPDSPADDVGMRVGDAVLAINNQDVSRATANTVARILRFHQEVYIEVQSPSAPTPSPWCRSPVPIQGPPSSIMAPVTKCVHHQGNIPHRGNIHHRGNVHHHGDVHHRGTTTSSSSNGHSAMRHS